MLGGIQMRTHSRARAFALLAAAAWIALSGPAWGQTDSSGTFKTGDELFDACTSADDAEITQCDWYLMGVHDAIVLHQDLQWVETAICVPEDTTTDQLRNVVVDYLRSSDQLSYTAVSMVYNALDARYACSDSDSGEISKK